ncbi:hypothetical protein [Variovorax sp. OK605]|uniref:hypothetical protein n=1 Tax=Variovorax sp. OK605 TaxID=1855317 RepID=UPI0011609B81|nr:hypothetical protein [Variovorax sp. OK605]
MTAYNGAVSLMFLAGFAKNRLSAFIFLGLVYTVSGLSARLFTQGVRRVFIGMLLLCVTVLTAGSIINGEFSRMLAASAGIRFRDSAEVIASAETCARVQQLALRASAMNETEDWSEIECNATGTRMRVDVQFRAAGRWLIHPLTLRGIKVPSTTERLSVPDAGLELVLPSLPKASQGGQ